MFRVKESDIPASLGAVAWLVAASLGLSWMISLILAVFGGGAPANGFTPAGLSVALAILISTAIGAFAWLWRRSVASQRALREVKLLAHDILASMDQGVVTTDKAGVVTSINSGATRLLGVSDACVGRPLAEISRPEVPLDALYASVVERHEPIRDQEYSVPHEAHTQRLLATAKELKDPEGRSLGCVIHLRDITERMRMKEQMWRLEQLAAMSTLATGLHHEIKNPLTALSLHVQLLDERLRDPFAHGPVDEAIAVLKSEITRLNGVLERFRSFANLDRLIVCPTDVVEIVDDLARLIRPQAEVQGVRLSVATPPADLPRVPLDAEKFREAVLNLVVNALESMPAGGDLSISTLAHEESLVVEVEDTGPGIPAGVRGLLFKPYVSTKHRGTGIGLALVEKLVSQHGGQVTFETADTGTTFRLTLPLAGAALAGGISQP